MDLDQIRTAPIESLLMARGFRRDRQRWACHAHKDKRPSCTVRDNRLHCWTCNKWWSNLDLVMELDGVDLRTAARHLAQLHGIPFDDRPLTQAERRAYANAAAQAEGIAQRLADFAGGLRLAVARPLSRLAPVLLEVGVDPAEALAHLHRGAHLVERATPQDVAATWRHMQLTHPGAGDLVEKLGRRDREHAEAITHAIVNLLAVTQSREVAA
jgi:hypothetical protein